MAAIGFTDPYKKFTDDDGAPLAAGKVYVYEAGTVTPLTTYLNADLDPAHANTNPVILDSAGGALFYFTPTPAFDYVVKTSAGATLYTVESVSPAAVAT